MSVTVRMEHARKLKYCSGGVRRLFKRYNLNYTDFLANGIDSDKVLEATNHDAMVKKVVEVAYGRQQ